MRRLWDPTGPRWGLVARRIYHVIRGLDFQSQPLDLQGVERGWRLNQMPMASDLISRDIMQPLQTHKDRVQITSGLMNT